MTSPHPTPQGETISAHDRGEDLPIRQTGGSHTPGPWHAFNHSWCETSVLADGFDHAVCLLDINYATEESQEADEAQMAANALLIAAAPDLLDLAKALEHAARTGNGDLALDENSPLRDALRAAIAKATGARP